jgi:pimeloyl-ACP methyl ester carboxylesterase/predicted glycosyltransferase
MTVTGTDAEQTRARYPDRTGYVERAGVRVFWEEYGQGEPTLFFLHGWPIAHSRVWKCQIPYFARHARVLTMDCRGNGRSDRPLDPAAHAHEEHVADLIAVLDATGTERAVVVGWSLGADRALLTAALHPDRVAGICVYGNGAGPTDVVPAPAAAFPTFDEPQDGYEGIAKFNRHYWERDYPGFADFFFSQLCTPEAHSTKLLEDLAGWAMETTPAELAATVPAIGDPRLADAVWMRVAGPMLVIAGAEDRLTPAAIGIAVAEATGAELLVMEGTGHSAPGRSPVRFNLAVRDFLGLGRPRRRTWRRAPARIRRALFVSSPIGLGHAWRDVAIARELRATVPDLQIDWLAQEPVTRVLEAEGERIHPASDELAREAPHIDAEAHGHELDVFRAYRRMDEILLANFMLFHDVVEQESYDVWIGDEAWEIDYFLHENPECKRAAYVWLSDFVGFLPMEEGGEREAFLTADYNAEMLEHVERFPRIRDRSILIGEPDDIVPDAFGPDLPGIRAWTEEHFTFTGYVPAHDAAVSAVDRDAVRAELGYGPDERICIATAGGSAAGEAMLRRVIDAHPAAAQRVPGLRTVVVAGPRIPVDVLPSVAGVEVVGYVHDLSRRLAACDVAVVHGGLATTMELVAARRPFLYFPLKRHFEQQRHVRHRLEHHRAGRCMDFDSSPPEVVADAIADEIVRGADPVPIRGGGARRAAALIAELL